MGQSTPVSLPREFHRQSLVGYSLWGHTETDMTEVTWCTHTTLVLSPLLLQEVRTVHLSEPQVSGGFFVFYSAVALLTRSSVLRVPMFVYQEENSGPLFGWVGDYRLISQQIMEFSL